MQRESKMQQDEWDVEVIRSVGEWEPLRGEWNLLAGTNLFCRWEWMRQWWRFYGEDRGELGILCLRDAAGRLRGAVPWWQQRTLKQGRVLRFLGSGNVCSDYLTLLGPVDDAARIGAVTADWLARTAGWDVLELDGAAHDDPAVNSLIDSCRESAMGVGEKPAMHCWRLELPSSWDGYLARLSKSHRKQLRRIDTRQLKSGRLRLRVAETEPERDRAFGELVRLHQLRWQSRNEPGAFACNRFHDFLWQMTIEWFDSGRVVLYELLDGDQTIAAEIHFVHQEISHAYQSGVDPNTLDREPGRAMNIAVIQHLISAGYRAIDYLRGDEPYKAHFRAEPRRMGWWRIASPRAAGRVRHGVWVAGGAMKSWIKTSLQSGGEVGR